jgi:DNA gyrase subunit A
LSDFVGIRQNGKIAMKPDEGVDIFSVETCSEDDDVILTTARGQAIRFPVTDVRVFQSRDSMGVRGIRLDKDDTIISMTIVKHMEATPAERAGYLRQAIAQRRLASLEEEELEEALPADDEEEVEAAVELSPERFAEMEEAEQFVLTVSAFGYGKRASTFDFRTSRRGGKGIKATDQSKLGEIGELVAAFPVEDDNQIMLVSDGGQLIRVPVNGIRFAGRATKGVRIFNTAADEKVVSVELVSDVGEDESEDDVVEGSEDNGPTDSGPEDNSGGEGDA